MKIDIYKIENNEQKYLSVPSGIDISQLEQLKDISINLQTLALFKSSIDLKASTNRVGLDTQDISKQIANHGYAIHKTAVIVKES